ncbi:MAG: hypothetical protein HC915_11775 [Anaerolineae bacterium]|nr:hypothetical protein [Anaerolineae bacterium]
MTQTTAPSTHHYLKRGVQFLRGGFALPFHADTLQVNWQRPFKMTYQVPLQQRWLDPDMAPAQVLERIQAVHQLLAEALLWTDLGKVDFQQQLGEVGGFFSKKHPAHRADWVLTGQVSASTGEIDIFKASMVLVLSMQIGLAGSLLPRYTRYGLVTLPLTQRNGEAIASILQTAADPTLGTLEAIMEHYVNSWCVDCAFFRASTTAPESGFCEWARAPVLEFLSHAPAQGDPLWRVFVTHPKLQTGFYNAVERQETADQYRDRVAQWFDEADQITLDPTTLHLVEDVLNAAKNEDELLDTDVVLPRALRLMDFWHSGYLPSSGEANQENPTLLLALEDLPDSLLPLVLSSLTASPPQYRCLGFLDNDTLETETGALQLRLKPLRDVLLQALPRRVLELLAVSFLEEAEENANLAFLRFLHEQASLSFERVLLDYDDAPMAWLFEPVEFHLKDVLYIHARMQAFVYDVTQETIRRVRDQDAARRRRRR